jgi:transposase-like protein
VDFLLTARRDEAAARRFFERAIDRHDVPEKITIDQSGANTAAVNGLVADSGVTVELRQSKYLNNLIEQDHRAIKRIVRPMLGSAGRRPQTLGRGQIAEGGRAGSPLDRRAIRPASGAGRRVAA